MKKIHLFTIALVGLVIAFAACNSSETYADKLKNQRKAIDNFIDEHDLQILSDIPADTIFGEKQYYLDPVTGVYIRVIEKGGEKITEEDNIRVTMRYDYLYRFGAGDTTRYRNTGMEWDLYTMMFRYGDASTYTQASYSSYYSNEYYDYLFKSAGCAYALRYVGDGGKVSLIVPFGSYASTMQNASYEPLYYGEITYKYYDSVGEEIE